MNNKSILLAGVLSLGLASVAGAAQYVYVTGSTAGRAAFYASITDAATVFDAAPTIITQGNATRASASYMNFHGLLGGVDTIVKCHWSGSEGGIGDLATGGTQQFLDDTAADSLTNSSPGPFVSSTVDLCGADNDKVYSRNPSAAITGVKVCVIPFKWEKQRGSAAGLTNVTDQNIRAAFAGGARLAQFTGNVADTTFVYVSGRDNQSGTRVNTFGDCGYGIFTTPFQLQVAANGSMISQAGSVYLGDFGYSSGGTLATQMSYDLAQASSGDVANGTGVEKFSVIAYMGISDANNAEANGATALTYNGVPYSVANVQEGLYNFWGNEYIYRKNTVSSQATTVFNKLTAAAGISGHANGVSEIKLSTMHAVRNGPTSDPSHL